jgi:predicted outer membrane repeat protein
VHSIVGSIFSGNYVIGNLGATYGGAVMLNVGTLNVDQSTFTGNSASGQGALGGAIYVDSGTLNVSFSRLAGNSASSGGSGVYSHGSNSAFTTATNNWWGCNGGPTIAGCDQVGSDGGETPIVTPWMVLTLTASPNPIVIDQPTTLTASFRQNSAGDPLTQANVSMLAGVPITFDGAVLGTISSPQTSIQLDGAATVTFIAAGSTGTGHANATVDGATVTASIAIEAPLNLVSVTLTISGPVIRFAGIPSSIYVVQSAPAVNGPWTDFADSTLTADSTGVITYMDSTSPAPQARFYRTRTGP